MAEPRVYATQADLVDGEWMTAQDIPADVGGQLRRASRLVDKATRTAVYAIGPDGAPTSPEVVAILRDATCAQVAYWAETGDASGAGAVWSETRIGGVSLRRADQAPGTVSGRYAPELGDILAPLHRHVRVP